MRRVFFLVPVVIAISAATFFMPKSNVCTVNKADLNLEALAGYQIVFAGPGERGSQDIWTSAADGTARRNLTGGTGKGADIYPEWAPDAAQIYYTSNKHGGDALELYRVNSVGEPDVQRLSDFGREVRSLSVSPDNRHILLGLMSATVQLGSDLSPYSSDLYVVSIETIEAKRAAGALITIDDLRLLLRDDPENHIWHEQPDWQPGVSDEESVILYTRTQNYDIDPIMVDEIWQTNLAGTINSLVLSGDSMPRWTVDGKGFTTHQFQYVDFETGQVSKLNVANISDDAGAASLSPTGDFILFESNDRTREPGIAQVSATGKTVSFACLSDEAAYEPRWSPVKVKPAK